MSNIRLYQFPTKAVPVAADLVYIADSAAAFDEANTTIADFFGVYPNVLALGNLTLGNNQVLATDGSGNIISTSSLPASVQLAVGSFANGSGASASTFWRGDGTWGAVSASGGLVWNTVTAASDTMAGGNGYITNNGSSVALTLPNTSSVGDVISIVGHPSGNGWNIVQGINQQIYIGSSASALGVGGSVASTNTQDSLTIVCVEADTVWVSLGGPQGALTIV